jgi:peptide/nickel transport system substrate-binding protein
MKKGLVASIIVMLCMLRWSDDGLGQEVPAPRGELRSVEKTPDHWVSSTFHVFEHLVELDKHGTLVPRLATGWQWLDERTLEVTLRQGGQLPNGEGFDAEIVRLNWEENLCLQQPHMIGEFLNCKPGSRLEIIDAQTLRFIFPEPDGGALVKLALAHIANRQFDRELGWGEKSWCILQGAGPWGTGPYTLVEGFS